ncbi:MAG: hypothetical protein KKD39_01335 [Candidatus Altiarchaeota archaeon]|nr:hypothetical protein [Candidatus Altiarchaeota archaeon]
MAEPDILEKISNEPNADIAMSRIMESPARRLHLTKAMIQQFFGGIIGSQYEPDFGVLPQMRLDKNVQYFIDEYQKNMQQELLLEWVFDQVRQ